jgi:polar amino acid transport system substrate-binding protein
MRRSSFLVALCFLALLAGACGRDNANPQPAAESASSTTVAPLFEELPQSLRIKREIKVGSDIEYAPIEFFKENTEEVQGLDYDLAQAMGAKLGVKMTFINNTDFAGMIGALQSGRFDIVMSAMNDTAERRGNGVDFIDYFSAGSSILVKKGNPKGITRVEDLCGHTVAVQKGTVQDTDILTPQEPQCKKAMKPLKVLRFEKDADALQQVKNGRAVANLEDFPVAAYNAQTSGGGADFDVVPGQIGRVGFYGIAVRSSDTRLRDLLQKALRAIIDDGTYDRILARWNLTAGALKTATINGGT